MVASIEEKGNFQEKVDELIQWVLDNEVVIVGEDLTGHVGKSRDGYERIHGDMDLEISIQRGKDSRFFCILQSHNFKYVFLEIRTSDHVQE